MNIKGKDDLSMVIKDISKLGYKIDKNYIFNEKDTLHYKIRLYFPYGIDREDLFIYPYISIFLAILDKYFAIPVNLSYEVGPNFTLIKADTFNINNIPIILGGIYNFMESIDTDKILEEIEDIGIKTSLLNTFLKENEKLYNEGRFDTLEVNHKDVPDLMYNEYSKLCNYDDNKIKSILKDTKKYFSEEKALVFLEGRQINKLNFKSYDLNYDEINNTSINLRNKFFKASGSRGFIVPITREDNKSLYVYYRILASFISTTIGNGEFIQNNPNKLAFYCNPNDTKTFSPNWIENDFLKNKDIIETYFKDFKSMEMQGLLEEFENIDSDIDRLLDKLTTNQIFFTMDELQDELVNIHELEFNDLIVKVVEICNDMYNACIVVEDDHNDGSNCS